MAVNSARLRRLLPEATWIVTGQIAAAVGSIVGVPLLAHRLRPEEYGVLALGGTVASLLQQISYGPVGNAAGRFYAPSVESESLRDYTNAAVRLMLYVTAIVTAVGVLALIGLSWSPWHSWLALASYSLFLPSSPAYQEFSTRSKAARANAQSSLGTKA